MQKENILSVFQSRFKSEPRIFRAPGRVNIIGEHTDNYDGFVFPMAIHLATYVAITPRDDRQLVIWSEAVGEEASCSLGNLSPSGKWSDYMTGVAAMLGSDGIPLPGANIAVTSDIPLGGGMSSSAALEVATALALLSLTDSKLNGQDLAKLCRKVENEFVGMNCGIMDQFTAVHGQAGKALLLDCRTLEYQPVALPSDKVSMVVCNTMVKHELGASEYNSRREETIEGTRQLQQHFPEIKALRDVTMDMLSSVVDKLPETIYSRCRHVISENERVLAFITALKKTDLSTLGDLINASHTSLKNDYQVSCSELDKMVSIARELPGVWGARMMGGGFGGCTINMVDRDQVDSFREAVSREYQKATGKKPDIYPTDPMDGASEIA
ncbi:MAG: galactokinase [Candidatus Marinimicrobia bacterium]|nr:galactokinase [Candidatus Neomarinimicrobiota bacterium]